MCVPFCFCSECVNLLIRIHTHFPHIFVFALLNILIFFIVVPSPPSSQPNPPQFLECTGLG